MDLYKRHWHQEASQASLVNIGRTMTIIFVFIGCSVAPQLVNPKFKGIFHYIQEFQGYLSPGILAAFVFGFIVKKAPPLAGVTALLLTVPIYGILQWQYSNIAFLNRMTITFVLIMIVMTVITWRNPLPHAVDMPINKDYDMHPAKSVVWLGSTVITGVIIFYIIFW
jgi:SSS family solute:Na+ symporter